jgi:hypothetical protein
VTFTAVLANEGNAAILDDFRVAFRIGGEIVSWADVTDPLLPRAIITMTANGGPDCDGVWSPTATDPFVVLAWVDEAGTLDELDAHNNMLTRSGKVQPPATRRRSPRPRRDGTPQPTAPAATATPAPLETPAAASGARISWLVGIVTAVVVFIVVVVVRLRRRSN